MVTENKKIINKCPVCNCFSYQPLLKKDSYDIVKCTNCHFVFVNNPFVSLNKYENNSITTKSAQPKFRHYEIKKITDSYFSHSNNVDILEIGSGIGALAGLFTADNKYHYLGFEPSTKRAEYAKAKGFNVKNDFFSLKKIEKQVDVIVVDNVLEHVPNPDNLVKEMSKALKKDGIIIIIIVPNLHDIRRFLPRWKERHYWQPHCHVNYFTYSNLKKLFIENGIKLRPFPLFFSGNFLFFINVLLNKINIFIFGIYCYGSQLQK